MKPTIGEVMRHEDQVHNRPIKAVELLDRFAPMNPQRARSINTSVNNDESKGPWRPTAVKDTGLEESFMQPVSRETPIKSYVSHTYNQSARSNSAVSRGSATKA